jgi:SH3-like domain-containing protein
MRCLKTKSLTVFSFSLLVLFSYALPCLAAEYASVNKDGVNIRSGPGTKDEVLWEVFKDFPLEIIKREGKWAKTKDFEGDTGWIYSPLLSKNKKVIVKVEVANMRTGPGQNYEPVASVKYGVVFTPIETEGDWLKVVHEDGTKGWIYKKLLWPN